MNRYKVTFLPDERTIEVPEGSTLMAAMNEAGLYFDFPCGGGKKCGKCRVHVLEGYERPGLQEIALLGERDVNRFIRLACLTKVNRNITVEFLLPNDQQHQILSLSLERRVQIDLHLEKRFLEIQKPFMKDNRSDWQRLRNALFAESQAKHSVARIDVLRSLPTMLRQSNFRLTALLSGGEVLAVEPGDTTAVLLGMAFDIGTTTVVGYLMDLYSGEQLALVSALNEQAQFGADVISRIMYAEQDDGLVKQQIAVLRVINNLLGEAVEAAGVKREDVYAVTFVGNTVMQHLLLGINPYQIAVAPFVPVVNDAQVFPAAAIHLQVNPSAQVYLLPNIGGFIGADTVAVLLATEMDRSNDVKLIIDIGTNGEIVLGSKEKLFACSTAAGPAFEGAQISCGMRGTSGAIDYIIFGEDLSYSLIGQGKPQGICGSALLDAVAGLLRLGLIERTGRFVEPQRLASEEALRFKGRLIQHEGSWAFQVVDGTETAHGSPIIITQRDIRELQMAKGAIATGIKILAQQYGVAMGDISEVLLAGAFGNYLNPYSACIIGLIPAELEHKVKMIGNAAGAGAKLALLSAAQYRRASEIAKSVQFVELGTHAKFMRQFAESMYF
jgi:uncharacterized 2Fe-2S/4Fe-4S cluster protein (DUF4445 family)